VVGQQDLIYEVTLEDSKFTTLAKWQQASNRQGKVFPLDYTTLRSAMGIEAGQNETLL
jgi:hypothetical protein